MKASNETILVTGGSGALGTAIVAECENNEIPFIAPAHTDFDITKPDQCRRFISGRKIRAIIHSAAIVDWQRIQDNPDEGFNVNWIGALNMAELARENRSHLVYASTDAVFDGQKRQIGYSEYDSPGNPVSLYGTTKLMGEWACKEANPRNTIARLGWLFGPKPELDQKFVGMIVRQIASGNNNLLAVDDKYGSPTYAVHAAAKLLSIVKTETTGVRHIANSGVASRHDVASEVAKLWGDSSTVVSPVSSNQFPSNVRRPDYSGLRTINDDVLLPGWRDALAEYHDRFPALSDFSNPTEPLVARAA